MKRSRLLAAFLATALGLSACTLSPVPITAAEPQPADPRLIGTWRVTIDEDVEIHRISALPNGRLRVKAASEPPQDSDEEFEVITAEIGGALYGSATSQDPEIKRPRFILFRYEHERPDRVQLFAAPMDALEEAVRLRRIEGSRVRDRHMESFELSSGAEELRGFVTQHGARVFSSKGPILERLPD